jgi:hypothetical protein
LLILEDFITSVYNNEATNATRPNFARRGQASMELSHQDCLEVIANPSTQTIVEKLGYEYSPLGLASCRKSRPNIMPALVRAVVTELEREPIFPQARRGPRPEVGVFIQKQDGEFVVWNIDKPSAWGKETFTTADGAATRFIRYRCDAYWLGTDVDRDERPNRVEFSR